MHRVPPIFFLEAQQYQAPPFWRHPSLKPLVEPDTTDRADAVIPVIDPIADERGDEDEDDREEDDKAEEGNVIETYQHDGQTFEEAISADIDLIQEFAQGLLYQIQFRDQRMLNSLQREEASFLRLARACIGKEKRMNSTRAATVATWEQSTSTAMFYRTRPTPADAENT